MNFYRLLEGLGVSFLSGISVLLITQEHAIFAGLFFIVVAVCLCFIFARVDCR